jgi:hypothetical protein
MQVAQYVPQNSTTTALPLSDVQSAEAPDGACKIPSKSSAGAGSPILGIDDSPKIGEAPVGKIAINRIRTAPGIALCRNMSSAP